MIDAPAVCRCERMPAAGGVGGATRRHSFDEHRDERRHVDEVENLVRVALREVRRREPALHSFGEHRCKRPRIHQAE